MSEPVPDVRSGQTPESRRSNGVSQNEDDELRRPEQSNAATIADISLDVMVLTVFTSLFKWC